MINGNIFKRFAPFTIGNFSKKISYLPITHSSSYSDGTKDSYQTLIFSFMRKLFTFLRISSHIGNKTIFSYDTKLGSRVFEIGKDNEPNKAENRACI